MQIYDKKVKRKKFYCTNCNETYLKWLGKCVKCSTWNSIIDGEDYEKRCILEDEEIQIKSTNEILSTNEIKIKTNLNEFDNVVGGGLVKGSVILIGGEPGVGKSTLLTNISGNLSKTNKVLYVTGEESISQILLRCNRLMIRNKNLIILNEIVWSNIKGIINKINPQIVVFDSIQTFYSDENLSSCGSINQVKLITSEIINITKKRSLTSIIVGHINKIGGFAGPKHLEHMVDVVLYFENSDDSQVKVLMSNKNRYYSTDYIGILKITKTGFHNEPFSKILNKSILENMNDQYISIVKVGNRLSLIKVESLITTQSNHTKKIHASGIDNTRINMILAIMEKYLDLSFVDCDLYIDIIGNDIKNSKNMHIDIAIVCSIYSAAKKKKLKINPIFIGNVGLNGEIKNCENVQVNEMIKYLNEQTNYEIVTGKTINQHKLNKQFNSIKNVIEYVF